MTNYVPELVHFVIVFFFISIPWIIPLSPCNSALCFKETNIFVDESPCLRLLRPRFSPQSQYLISAVESSSAYSFPFLILHTKGLADPEDSLAYLMCWGKWHTGQGQQISHFPRLFLKHNSGARPLQCRFAWPPYPWADTLTFAWATMVLQKRFPPSLIPEEAHMRWQSCCDTKSYGVEWKKHYT